MPNLVLGIVIMLAGAVVMAVGLYVRSIGTRTARGAHTVPSLASSSILVLLGLVIVVAGIILSLEPHTTAPR